MKKLSKNTRNNTISYAIVIAGFLAMELLSLTGGMSSALKGQLVPICAYVIMALSLNLTVGVLGELSLGHAGFMSVGAFTGAIACTALENVVPDPTLRLIIGVVLAAIFAAIFGFLIGIPVLRLNGDYLAIVTLAFGEIIKSLINNLYVGVDSKGLHFAFLADSKALGLEEAGKIIVDGPKGINGISKISTFVFGIVLVIIALIVIQNLVNSRSGRAIMALRDNRIAAESVGIRVTKYKLMAFTTSAALAGMAGCLYAMNYSTIVAKTYGFNTSILILVFVVLGGLGNMWGSIISATVLTVLPQVLRGFDDYRMIIYAVVLILVMITTNNPTTKARMAELSDLIKSTFRKQKEPEEGGNDDV